MTSWISNGDIDRHFGTMRRAKLGELQTKLKDAVARARRSMSSVPDGFPAGGFGGSSGGGAGSSVEAAAAARTWVSPEQFDVHVAAAQVHLVEAARHLAGLEGRIRLIDAAVGNVPVIPDQCEWCKEIGERVDADHFGSVGGRLTQQVALCVPHYQFVVRFGVKPSVDQSRQHSRTGRWRVRV